MKKSHRKKRHNRKTRKAKGKFWFQSPTARFPRLFRYPRVEKGHENDIQMLPLLRKMREEYPLPYYDPWRDGSSNRAEAVITWAFNLTVKKLKEKCFYHGLSKKGTRFQMVRSLYLHYRSSRLKLGFPLIAYGLEHENENPSQCDCGKVKKIVKRFPRLIKRYPRLKFPVGWSDMGRLKFINPGLYKKMMDYLHGKI